MAKDGQTVLQKTLYMQLKTISLMLCLLFSGCTAHTINSNVNVSICVRAL